MSQVPVQVTTWLHNVLKSQYYHFEIAYQHIYNFLQVHLSKNLKFRPRTSVYTSTAGRSELLLNLYGTIISPNSQDHIFVQIWVPLNYPFVDNQSNNDSNGIPMVYVIPDNTKGQSISPGNHIDSQGRFYHPYLSDWFRQSVSGDGRGSTRFNLLELLDIVFKTLALESPVKYVSVVTGSRSETGLEGTNSPPIPAKVKLHEPMSLNAVAPEARREFSGPPIPRKGFSLDQNSKHIDPPLPYSPPSLNGRYSGTSFAELTSGSIPIKDVPIRNIPSHKAPEKGYAEITDLMDTEIPQSKNVASHNLEELETDINEVLTDPHYIRANQTIARVNKSTKEIRDMLIKVDSQNKVAIANRRILDTHVNYLEQQLKELSNLNLTLSNLDNLNANDKRSVFTSSKDRIQLENLIIPDSQLVGQLYEIVANIKSIKDTIALMLGDINNKQELISDSNIDISIKYVRSLGRELFWLELLKSEASSIMRLNL